MFDDASAIDDIGDALALGKFLDDVSAIGKEICDAIAPRNALDDASAIGNEFFEPLAPGNYRRFIRDR